MEKDPNENGMNRDALKGLDPVELLMRGAEEDTLIEGAKVGFEPPSAEELAAIFPKFEIKRLVGQGGMGAVYEVRQKELDRLVALKILPPAIGGQTGFAERFMREARALAKLNHPGIVTLHEFGQAGGLYFIVMEYVDGVNLRGLLTNGRVSPREALAIVPQICDALQFAHDHGIIHRDIKPENILIDRAGRVKVADFGLAKLVGAEQEPAFVSTAPVDLLVTEAGKVMGTPDYMAPEQIERPDEVDHRADIYALGVVFYQMLTGELPAKGISAPSAKVRIDVRLDEVVLRALEKNPEMRFQQASAMKTKIEDVGSATAVRGGSPWNLDHRSKATLFGLPLLHVTSGPDPETGRERIAKGIIAIGGRARGVLAIGGTAAGVVAMGGVSTGVVAFGGAAIGLVSFGGLALGLLGALGGMAIAPVAIGGNALGYYSFGGSAHGVHALGGNARDPVAKEFFHPWSMHMIAHVGWALSTVAAFVFLVGFGVPMMVMKHLADRGNPTMQMRRSTKRWWTVAGLAFLAMMLAWGAWMIFKPDEPKTEEVSLPQYPREQVIIEVLPEGQVRMDGQRMGTQELTMRIAPMLHANAGLAVVISSSHQTKYDDIIHVIKIVQSLPVLNLSFITGKTDADGRVSGVREFQENLTTAEEWLGLIDKEKFTESWENSSPAFRNSITAQAWELAVTVSRGRFGEFVSRRFGRLTHANTSPGAPDGDYLVIEYESVFSRKDSVVETLTLAKQADGSWKAAGYFIR